MRRHSMIDIRRDLSTPGAERLWYLGDAFRAGMTIEEIHSLSRH